MSDLSLWSTEKRKQEKENGDDRLVLLDFVLGCEGFENSKLCDVGDLQPIESILVVICRVPNENDMDLVLSAISSGPDHLLAILISALPNKMIHPGLCHVPPLPVKPGANSALGIGLRRKIRNIVHVLRDVALDGQLEKVQLLLWTEVDVVNDWVILEGGDDESSDASGQRVGNIRSRKLHDRVHRKIDL